MLDKITATIVTYKNPDSVLLKAINSFLNTKIEVRLYIIDNSPTNYLKDISHDPRVEYIFMNSNNGFGAGHNVILRDPEKMGKYHLILNPDISFEEGTLEKLYDYMEGKPDVGNVMPKVIYPNGELQYLCKVSSYAKRLDSSYVSSY
ncbi:glycosyltransferase [Bacteroides fragilis]|nr:glycosyltransferase [Bacteroides fragilis]UVQ16952.1 glycosyltransferase [Bacteroides fragilis]